jgi:hypothetical protein
MREITNSVVHEISSSMNWHDTDTGIQNQNQEIGPNHLLAVRLVKNVQELFELINSKKVVGLTGLNNLYRQSSLVYLEMMLLKDAKRN